MQVTSFFVIVNYFRFISCVKTIHLIIIIIFIIIIIIIIIVFTSAPWSLCRLNYTWCITKQPAASSVQQ